MRRKEIIELVNQLTIEEKASLTTGENVWATKSIERLDIPAICTSDGPHGLRKLEEDDMSMLDGKSMSAVCFPAACATAASFDRELLKRLGIALGKESQSVDVDVLLGPGVNIKRSPLCGRNFEYFSEDPFLAGELGAAYVKGVQSQGVGTSLKHFFANNQEYRRMDSSSQMDERTMREIYLTVFEKVIKEGKPWTIMASYNKINNVYSTENKQYLTELLREEWEFEGLVMSDWGATHNRIEAVKAGCDLTMPGEASSDKVIEAVKSGELAEEDLNLCCRRVLELAFKTKELDRKEIFDYEEDHILAGEIAGESMVLLKNNGVLPLQKEKTTAFIGAFAKQPRIQGGGSSYINATKVTSALEAAKNIGLDILYAPAYNADGSTSDLMLKEAIQIAGQVEQVVLFIGLPDCMESEGSDRIHMNLPEGHDKLVEEICKINSNTVVVLYNGSPIEMPWVDKPAAIIEAYLGGEAIGEATVDVLYGAVNPSGHLPETFPKKLEDNPSFLSYFGEDGEVQYQEGIFVGYRYYETKKQEVLFPFGYGLSYTTFSYSDLTLEKDSITDEETLKVSVKVTNTGKLAGKAVVQLYIAPEKRKVIRPIRELKEFAKIALAPGESKVVEFELNQRSFAHWNTVVHQWRCETGVYAIQIGENAHDICLSKNIKVDARPIPPNGGYTESMPMNTMAEIPAGRKFLDENIVYMIKGMSAAGYIPKEMLAVIENIPGGLTIDAIEQLVKQTADRNIGGGTGVDALLGQSLALLQLFLPEEKIKEMQSLLKKMNSMEDSNEAKGL